MPSDTYETFLDLEDEYDVEILVTFSWSRYRPAVRHGPTAGPAEGGIDEITSAVRVDTGEELVLTSADYSKLLLEISDNTNPEQDYEDGLADYRYELSREDY